ncbi:MAG: lysophospholipase [Euryarchaeota archaeon]|nr:lysophospholipase [Euryarchaeota archaeon]
MAKSAEAGSDVDTRPVVSKEVTLESEGVKLHAVLWQRDPLPQDPDSKRKVKEGAPEAPPRAWCILSPGLLSDHREFGDLPRLLAEAGFGALAIDHKGHGKSEGTRGMFTLDSMVSDIEAAKRYLRNMEEQWDLNAQQLCLIGHSLGAVAALKAGQTGLYNGDHVIAAAPFRTIAEEIGPLRRLGYRLAYALRGGKAEKGKATLAYDVDYHDILEDPRARDNAKQIGFLERRIPIDNYPELMSIDGEEIARKVMDPTVLIIAASKDKVVSNRASRALYDAVPSAKQWWLIEGSGHSMFLDGRRQVVCDRIIAYLKPRLSFFSEVMPGSTKRADLPANAQPVVAPKQ